MSRRVLSVGNCSFDNGQLQSAFSRHFSVDWVTAATADDATRQLDAGTWSLVLVNRLFDLGGDSGLDLIRQWSDGGRLGELPVMLLSNYAEYQEQAVAAGAKPGFGKGDLRSPDLIERLQEFLG